MKYSIENYGKKGPFASFLPGIAGIKGIPVWCYYVNRGQGVVSFGIDNKDGAIMEFYPAHMAYQNVKRTGFRTFVRRNGQFSEAFSDERIPHSMTIDMNGLEVEEENKEAGYKTHVSYFVLPEENVGALVRKVEITNLSKEATFEILDGMPNVIPFGIGQESMKNMTQTAKAWMQVENHTTGVPYFRVRVSTEDTAEVSDVLGGNFGIAYDEAGNRLSVAVDPEAVFGYDLSLGYPAVFAEGGLTGVSEVLENISNLLPMCFFKKSATLGAGESVTLYEMIGQVVNQDVLNSFAEKLDGVSFFERKAKRAQELTVELTDVIATKTGNSRFDDYVKYTYMDNVLRGGFPIKLPGDKIFYVYSRKHGDLERDYNYFSMLPEFYSQGNGNFRDVNQNRRCDTFFAPFVGTENIHTFYNLIQLDGYNPLAIEKMTYTHPSMEKAFTPGGLYASLMESVDEENVEKEFERVMREAKPQINAAFGEGYWSDHWTYNLDLVEEYLELFPDKLQELLFTPDYTYFLSQANINPRRKRYTKTKNGIRQYNALNKDSKRVTTEKQVMGINGPYMGTLMEKLVLLCTTKFAALDPYGMGVEMEGGKPGWYDALNGLPAMLGSSMAEAYELKRMLEFTISVLEGEPKNIKVFSELADLIKDLEAASKGAWSVDVWNAVNDIKEAYREAVYEGISGAQTVLCSQELLASLKLFNDLVGTGIERAKKLFGGNVPTYFSYEVTKFSEDEDGIYPEVFSVSNLPAFLEGPVRYLKLNLSIEQKREIYNSVKNSDLYDEPLKMYKVNAALEEASFEIGRCRAFTPGWLENESVWLHMEYKYLLELLKSGLYEEFAADFKTAAVPFLDEEVYGRSVLENSSFIVSSMNPNKKIHGKGFVARLSGSTIEFISMWKNMMFGAHPFVYENGELKLNLTPFIPDYLVPEDGVIETTLLGSTKVIYHLDQVKSYIPGSYTVTGDTDVSAVDVRDGKVSKIELYLH